MIKKIAIGFRKQFYFKAIARKILYCIYFVGPINNANTYTFNTHLYKDANVVPFNEFDFILMYHYVFKFTVSDIFSYLFKTKHNMCFKIIYYIYILALNSTEK